MKRKVYTVNTRIEFQVYAKNIDDAYKTAAEIIRAGDVAKPEIKELAVRPS